MADGRQPASSSRMTRCVSTWVLPEPALAETQAERAGSEASACRSVVQSSHPSGVLSSGPVASLLIIVLAIRGCPFGDACQMIVFPAVITLLLDDQPRGEAVSAADEGSEQLPEFGECLVRQLFGGFRLLRAGAFIVDGVDGEAGARLQSNVAQRM